MSRVDPAVAVGGGGGGARDDLWSVLARGPVTVRLPDGTDREVEVNSIARLRAVATLLGWHFGPEQWADLTATVPRAGR